jgi:hypothetical protein
LIKLDFSALGRPTTQNVVNQKLLLGFSGNFKASNKSPVPLPEILAKV